MEIPQYKSIQDKQNSFDCKQINSKEELDKLISDWSKIKEEDYIFRGMNDARYKLYNSAQRAWTSEELHKLGGSYKDFIIKEIDLAKAFQDGLLVKFFKSFGMQIHDFSILGFLQHYGAPTPLLDFTSSFDKALFFGVRGLQYTPSANDSLGNYFSIYAIQTRGEFTSIIAHFDSNMKQIDDLSSRKNNITNLYDVVKDVSTYKELEALKLFYVPYMQEPYEYALAKNKNLKITFNQHNLNIISQEGVLVFNNHYYYPLEEYFYDDNPHPSNIEPHDQDEFSKKDFNNPFYLPKIKCWNIHKSLSEYVTWYLTEARVANRLYAIDNEFMFPQEEFIANSVFREFKQFK